MRCWCWDLLWACDVRAEVFRHLSNSTFHHSTSHTSPTHPAATPRNGMERRRPALIAGAAYSHCARCLGEFCDHIRLLDPSRDLLFGSTAPSTSTSCSSSAAVSQDIARANDERERARRIMQWVLTEEEYGKLEEGGDLAQLRIAERIDPFAYRTVPSKQVDTVKNEHRASRAKLAIAEEACLIPEEDWAKLIKAHASNSRRGRSIGPTPSPGEVLVCEICYHVYTAR